MPRAAVQRFCTTVPVYRSGQAGKRASVKIVWAASYEGRQRGSFIPALESVARRAIGRGDSLDVVVPDIGPTPWHDQVRALGAGVRVVPNGRAAAAVTRDLRPDVVHAHFDNWLVAVTLALWTSRARLLWHVHSTRQPDGGPLRRTPKRWVKFGLVGRRVAAFVCVTRTIAGEVAELGADPRRVVVVRNAVDTERFRPPDAETRARLRARLGLDARPAVAFFGRDPAIKGADYLAAALPAVPGVVVVAVATPEDARAELARSAPVVDVPFLEDVREVLWAVDAVVIPSRGEGMPYVALEALACGIPVAASDLGWAQELAAERPGVTLARRGDPDSLAAALRTVTAAGALPGPQPADGIERWTDQIMALYDGTALP